MEGSISEVNVLSQCCGFLSIYRCPNFPSRNRALEPRASCASFGGGKNLIQLSLVPCSTSPRCNACLDEPHLLRVNSPRFSQDDSVMVRFLRNALSLKLGFLLVSTGWPVLALAQLVREAAPAQQANSKAPSGKKRVSQEVQITGDQDWVDTGIDVQPGEHVVVTATGKLRYGDAKEDNGPDGIARGFRDLLRVLPFNEAGRGALIGRIGDKDIAQPFLVGGHRDVVAPIAGRLALGINQASDDVGSGTYVVRVE